MVEGGVDHTRLYSLGNIGAQYGIADATINAHPVAMIDAALFGIMRVNLDHIFAMPSTIIGTSGLSADIVLGQNPTGGQQQWELAVSALLSGHIFCHSKKALTAHKFIDMHYRRTLRRLAITGPLDATLLLQLGIGHAVKSWGQTGNFIHNL